MSDKVHVVVRGDTLSGIAKKYGTTLARLIQLNPHLRKNPHRILPEMEIRISDKTDATDALKISRMVFNGKELIVYSIKGGVLARYPATSGLPANASHLKKLIEEEGRKDLKIDTDYTRPSYQHVKDAGPIPKGDYGLRLKLNMPYDKSVAAGDLRGWGEGGWILEESFWAKLDNLWGGRFGFFLHHDGGNPGTGGCIGLKNAKDMKKLKNMLIRAQTLGQKSVPIEVRYHHGE
ncbi:LysM peptidoglycan-binding domain-containing protein [Candidatus Thiosymbion oneisti]|uniref:LysM peptidoglycan-binding domain-containing protein n=1 Tax=Candidatus Thiosymbion oneisti TaxID=589554 RepID=UPI00105DC8D8|nr:LysM peptidoglycan-binding domain-containing protein [Candidatus Thiosymbion oneisti]